MLRSRSELICSLQPAYYSTSLFSPSLLFKWAYPQLFKWLWPCYLLVLFDAKPQSLLHTTYIREAHIILGFQTLGYIPLSCFLQSKLFLAGLVLVGPKYLTVILCHKFLHRPNSSKQALQRISQLPYCHSQALVQKFSSLHALLFPLGTICLTYIMYKVRGFLASLVPLGSVWGDDLAWSQDTASLQQSSSSSIALSCCPTRYSSKVTPRS